MIFPFLIHQQNDLNSNALDSQEITHYQHSRIALHMERSQLKQDVHILHSGGEALKDTRNGLKKSNLAMLDMNRKLESFNENLQQMNVDSLETLSSFQQRMSRLKDKYYDI